MSNEQITKTSETDQKKKNYKLRKKIGAGLLALGGLTAGYGALESTATSHKTEFLAQDLDKAAKEGKVGKWEGSEYKEHPLTQEHLQEFADEAKEAGSRGMASAAQMAFGASAAGIGYNIRKVAREDEQNQNPKPQDKE